MSKSILVIDTPEYCSECPCSDECAEICRAIDSLIVEVNGECKKPDWCPLKDVPEERNVVFDDESIWAERRRGWNTCIDEILKGENGNERDIV